MASPYLAMFEQFKMELDEHYDRREKIIKASRDITAASKKIIFALQRVKTTSQPIPDAIVRSNKTHWEAISKSYHTIHQDLLHVNNARYARNITGGNQELLEALTFQHYLETETLIPLEQVNRKLQLSLADEIATPLSLEDYLLGIYDMTGELMRFAITTLATSDRNSTYKSTPQIQVLDHLRSIRALLQSLEAPRFFSWARDADKKMEVLDNSVAKVEKTLYAFKVRGAERPATWLTDSNRAIGS